SQRSSTMAVTFTASALKSVRNASPAVRALRRETIQPYIPPAAAFTDPPRAADKAPSLPQGIAASSERTAMAITCHSSTVRKGLILNLSDRVGPAKQNRSIIAGDAAMRQSIVPPGKVPRYRTLVPLEAAHQALELVQAGVVDDDAAPAAAAGL